MVGHSLTAVQYVPVKAFEVWFSESIDGATFGTQAVTVSGPQGPVAVTGVTQLDVDHFRIDLPATVRDATFTVAIAPIVADLAGNRLACAWLHVHVHPAVAGLGSQ